MCAPFDPSGWCTGTNTYLVGQHNPYVLVDTGQGLDEYIPVLRDALTNIAKPEHSTKPDVSDIILTHRHHDHCNGLPSVLTLLRQLWTDRHGTAALPFRPPRIHKIPLPSTDPSLQEIFDNLPRDNFVPNASGGPIHDLRESQTLTVSSSSPDSQSHLHILHTPGHTIDSLCLYYPADRALFTADTILGKGTAVFEDLQAYMYTLQKLIDFGKDSAHGVSKYGPIYPGHGPVVDNGLELAKMYLLHRQEREEQILEVLNSPSEDESPWTTWDIVAHIYQHYPRALWEPAAHSMDLHLRKLEAEARVKRLGGEGYNVRWQVV